MMKAVAFAAFITGALGRRAMPLDTHSLANDRGSRCGLPGGSRCSSLAFGRAIEGRSNAADLALALRGGADAKEKKENSVAKAFNSITPTTRTWLLGCLVMAVLTLAGVPEELFLFEWRRTFLMGQFWRPFTSSCFLGKVDMGMASQIYFLVSYGQEMERQDGSAQHGMFILTQMVLLMGLSSLIGFPSLSRSLIAAAIYCCSRREPMRPMEIQFGIRIEYWLLPYVNMIIDCLQSQSAMGAVPHVLGILTGHFYHFFSIIWPKMGGRRYLAAPGVLKAAYEPKVEKKAKKASGKKAATKASSKAASKAGTKTKKKVKA